MVLSVLFEVCSFWISSSNFMNKEGFKRFGMGSKRCMNAGCGATEPGGQGEWRKGWGLKSGGFATLCDKCRYSYIVFLDSFSLFCVSCLILLLAVCFDDSRHRS